MSRKVMVCAGATIVEAASKNNTHHGDTEARRKRKVHLFSEPQCLRGGFCLRETHHRCSPGAALAVRRLAGALFKTGSGTDTCSWIFCRSLLSSGLSWRYGPVMACADSSALKRR